MTAQLPGPDRPVPYSLTPKAEAALAMPEPELGPYPTFDDDPARWGLKLPGPQTAAGLETEATLEFWGPEGPYASYAEYLADGRREPDPEAEP